MKVLQINSFFTVGGPPRIVNGIYDTLIEEGHECKVAAAREKMYKAEDSIQIGKKRDVYFNALSCRLFDNEGFYPKSATQKLIKQIKEYDPDVIHLHNLHGYYINVEVLFDYLKQSGKKIYWTLHDCWAFTGHCTYFSAVNCEQWKTHCLRCTQIREYPSCYFKGNVSKNFDRKKRCFTGVPDLTIITPSNWLADLVKQSFLGEYSIKVIYNKIDTNVFKPTASNFRKKFHLEGQKVILGVAQNWSNRKGLHDFIKLAGMLDKTYTIVLVGITQKQIEKLPKQIIGLQKVNNTNELAKVYSAADLFVNCTYEDNFPTVNLEALACGTPVVTYQTGGSPESLDETCGRVVKQGDILQMLKEIKTITGMGKDEKACVKRAKFFDRQLKRLEFLQLYER